MKNKENAVSDFLDMIRLSWTWEKLTNDEQTQFVNIIPELSGTYLQRYDTLQFMYHAYLAGLGYKPVGWRETA